MKKTFCPKILIIRFSSIGDIVLATPVFRCIKKQIPDCKIHFVTKESFKDVTVANPYIDNFFYYNNNLDALIELFKTEAYDYVIDLHNNLRSNKIKSALKVKNSYTLNKLTFQKFILTKLHINIMPKRHITQRSLDAVKPLGVADDGLGLDYFIPPGDNIKTEDLPAPHQLGFIAVVIGASYNTKKMPVNKLTELCEKIKFPLVLVGGKEDETSGKAIANIDPIRIYNACGKFNLNESADILRKSKFVISHDTGMQYIACAFNKFVLAIWGGTSPKLQVQPYYGSNFNNLNPKQLYENIVLNLWCQPCSKYGKKNCPLGHFNCMQKHDINSIAKKTSERLNLASNEQFKITGLQ